MTAIAIAYLAAMACLAAIFLMIHEIISQEEDEIKQGAKREDGEKEKEIVVAGVGGKRDVRKPRILPSENQTLGNILWTTMSVSTESGDSNFNQTSNQVVAATVPATTEIPFPLPTTTTDAYVPLTHAGDPFLDFEMRTIILEDTTLESTTGLSKNQREISTESPEATSYSTDGSGTESITDAMTLIPSEAGTAEIATSTESSSLHWTSSDGTLSSNLMLPTTTAMISEATTENGMQEEATYRLTSALPFTGANHESPTTENDVDNPLITTPWTETMTAVASSEEGITASSVTPNISESNAAEETFSSERTTEELSESSQNVPPSSTTEAHTMLIPLVTPVVENSSLQIFIESVAEEEFTSDCDEILKETDKCMLQLLTWNAFPNDVSFGDRVQCRDRNGLVDCLSSYSSCLFKFPRTLYRFNYRSVRDALLNVCDNTAYLKGKNECSCVLC